MLRLHPKFCLIGNLKLTDLEHEQEAALAKMRMEISKEQEQEELNEEEKYINQEIEAKARQVFDPVDKTYDARKRRVTDLQECTRITLPKPLSTQEEVNLEMRRTTQHEIFRKFINKNTDKNGAMRSNLTEDEKSGLKSLQKRINNRELIILKTDKSSKFAVTSEQEYLKMGQEHTSKDREITRQELIEIEENLNGHNRAWA